MAPGSGCKVDSVVARYDLDAGPGYESIHRELLARWRGDDDHASVGYRPLTEWFNKRLLKVVYDRHGRDTLGARLDGDFAALTGDDDLRRREVLDDLAADGIDGEALVFHTVSWGTMRTHLTDCLDGEKPREPASTDWERESVRIATDRAAEKVHEAVGSLARKGRVVGAGAATAEIDVSLACDRCGARVPFAVAADRGYVCERHHADTAPTDPA